MRKRAQSTDNTVLSRIYGRGREAQSSLRPGALRLTPLPEQLAAWKQDYQSMREDMFFGQAPSFEEIIGVVRDFEKQFNRFADTR